MTRARFSAAAATFAATILFTTMKPTTTSSARTPMIEPMMIGVLFRFVFPGGFMRQNLRRRWNPCEGHHARGTRPVAEHRHDRREHRPHGGREARDQLRDQRGGDGRDLRSLFAA